MAQKMLNEWQMQNAETEFTKKWLTWLGPNHAARAARIDALFEERTATMWSTYYADLSQRTWSEVQHNYVTTHNYVFSSVSRSLSSMDFRERTFLRYVELLNSATNGSSKQCQFWRASLIWGDGKGTVGTWQKQGDFSSIEQALDAALWKVDRTLADIQADVHAGLNNPQLSPEIRAVVHEFAQQATPAGDGSWLKPSEIAASPFAPASRYALHIGSFANGTPLNYSGEGSIVTIAPPASGKTQCNVFPNLLTWTGPAVVLDISGDIYEKTAAWRQNNVGPVYKFSPLEPDDSHKYNPLTFVRRDPDYIWEDSRLLAEMMIVPGLNSEPFWENEARTLLTAAIAHVCFNNPADQGPMHALLDILYGGPAWDSMLRGLELTVDVRVMAQHATALRSMNEKTLSSVLQVARSSLGAWAGERIARATSKSDWSPDDLRSGSNPTVYIYIRPNEVDAYLSLLRVFIGQHIRKLTSGKVPPPGSPPILFMLDELPRLRNMPPVDEALNIGRKYGLRLWMFAQSVGQLQKAYDNADGMLSSCAVRIYMNPSGADGLAEKISEELGYVESVNDNSRRRLVEATDLAGPKYRDRQIVISSGGKPVIVTKDYAYKNSDLSARMKTPDTQPAAKKSVTCPHCNTGQRVPSTASKFRCGRCNQISETGA